MVRYVVRYVVRNVVRCVSEIFDLCMMAWRCGLVGHDLVKCRPLHGSQFCCFTK